MCPPPTRRTTNRSNTRLLLHHQTSSCRTDPQTRLLPQRRDDDCDDVGESAVAYPVLFAPPRAGEAHLRYFLLLARASVTTPAETWDARVTKGEILLHYLGFPRYLSRHHLRRNRHHFHRRRLSSRPNRNRFRCLRRLRRRIRSRIDRRNGLHPLPRRRSHRPRNRTLLLGLPLPLIRRSLVHRVIQLLFVTFVSFTSFLKAPIK